MSKREEDEDHLSRKSSNTVQLTVREWGESWTGLFLNGQTELGRRGGSDALIRFTFKLDSRRVLFEAVTPRCCWRAFIIQPRTASTPSSFLYIYLWLVISQPTNTHSTVRAAVCRSMISARAKTRHKSYRRQLDLLYRRPRGFRAPCIVWYVTGGRAPSLLYHAAPADVTIDWPSRRVSLILYRRLLYVLWRVQCVDPAPEQTLFQGSTLRVCIGQTDRQGRAAWKSCMSARQVSTSFDKRKFLF